MNVAQNMFLGALMTSLGVFTDAAEMRAGPATSWRSSAPRSTRAPRDAPRRAAPDDEIARALLAEARVIAMDEPTSSLTPHEFDRLSRSSNPSRRGDVAVIYVSHKLEEVFRYLRAPPCCEMGGWSEWSTWTNRRRSARRHDGRPRDRDAPSAKLRHG